LLTGDAARMRLPAPAGAQQKFWRPQLRQKRFFWTTPFAICMAALPESAGPKAGMPPVAASKIVPSPAI